MDNTALYKLIYGVFVLTAKDGRKDNGCIINTATQVASTPLQISVSICKLNYTHDMVLKTGAYTLSVLSEDADYELYKHFGFLSGKVCNVAEDSRIFFVIRIKFLKLLIGIDYFLVSVEQNNGIAVIIEDHFLNEFCFIRHIVFYNGVEKDK
mgnify:CR=1 FL=1